MRILFFILVITIMVAFPSSGYSQAKRSHLMGMYGGGWYNKEGDIDSDYAWGVALGYELSDPISVEMQLHYMPVGGDEYYFLLAGGRYHFVGADFFMTPSVDLHGGVLVPQGEKTDIDGAVGVGGMLLYKTRPGLEFGPQISSTLVFEGPHIAVWANCLVVIKYRFY